MEYSEFVKEIPIELLLDELERRFPIGVVIGYVTDDPSVSSGIADKFTTSGPISVQTGLIKTLATYVEIELENMTMGFGSIEISPSDDDDEDDML